MNLLLDTHVFLWWRKGDDRLTAGVIKAIEQADEVHVSVLFAWETAIKISLRRVRYGEPFEQSVLTSGFKPLLVTFEHAERYAVLPVLHRDPFDRMLVAQALVERLVLVTADRNLAGYDVPILDAR